MKKLPLNSRGWVIVAVVSGFLMIAVLQVAKQQKESPQVQPTGTSSSQNVPLNTLDDGSPPPPMPGMTDLSGSGGGTTPPPPPPKDPPLELEVPLDRPDSQPVAQKEPVRMPTVWVTEVGAKAYSEPGFNMPVLRELEQWEELLIVETSKENWDRVQDLQGQQFWVQKKIVTIIRPQNLSQPSVAEKKVMDFYTQVAHREHSDAYVHLSPEWKRELSFDRFVKGYSHVDSLRSEIVNVLELGADRFQVDVAMEAIEEGASVDYLGIYTVEKVDGRWYLTTGSLNKQAREY
jgi:hypothetical protein